MKWLLNKAILTSIQHRLEHGTRLLLFVNYDSVLAPRAAGHAAAPLEEPVRKQLRELSEITRLTLTLVSDHSLATLKKIVGFSGGYFIANHGLEIAGPDLNVIHAEAKRSRPQLAKLAGAVSARLSSLPDVRLDDRGLSLALNFSQARPGDQRRTRLLLEELWTPVMDQFTLQEKNREMILRPRVGWGKGRAVMFLWNKFASPRRRPLVVYLGSDEGEEDIYNVLGREGLGIALGPESRLAHVKASYFVKSRAEANRFFSWLAGALA